MHETKPAYHLTPDQEITLLMNLLVDDCPISRRILELAYDEEEKRTRNGTK